MTVKVTLPVEKILAARGLGLGGGAQRYLGEIVRRRCDRYVPFDTGRLKNTAVLSGDGRKITYVQPYAAKQFYVNYHHVRDPVRGSQWHRRMLQREGNDLLRELSSAMKGGRL